MLYIVHHQITKAMVSCAQQSVLFRGIVRLILLCVSISSSMAIAQEQFHPGAFVKIDYVLKYRPDTSSTVLREETARLLTYDNRSYFASEIELMLDSITYFGVSSEKFIRGKSKNLRTVKNFAEGKSVRYTLILNDYVSTEDSLQNIDWTIAPDTATIAGFRCQKATTNFGGRKWIAWFTPEIPIFDGPFKFSGLPGLIIKLHDSGIFWAFEFMGLEKHQFKELILPFAETAKKVSPSELRRRVAYFKENALMMAEAAGLTKVPPELREEYTQRSREGLKKENNEIEILPF